MSARLPGVTVESCLGWGTGAAEERRPLLRARICGEVEPPELLCCNAARRESLLLALSRAALDFPCRRGDDAACPDNIPASRLVHSCVINSHDMYEYAH